MLALCQRGMLVYPLCTVLLQAPSCQSLPVSWQPAHLSTFRAVASNVLVQCLLLRMLILHQVPALVLHPLALSSTALLAPSM